MRLKELETYSISDGLRCAAKFEENNLPLFVQSVSLWCDYLNFVQEHDPSVREWSPEGISKARKLFERAITAAGLHVAEGTKIWEAYM